MEWRGRGRNSPGVPHCEFQGTSGTGSVTWKAPPNDGTNQINDGSVHEITCMKTDTQVSISVDGKPAVAKPVNVGSIAPSGWPLSIGGKSRCNGTTVDCDYYNGGMNFALVTVG